MPDDKKLTISISADDHSSLKALAALKGQTIKQLILDALNKTFPDWRNMRPNLDACKK